jgi:hypothetical protein
MGSNRLERAVGYIGPLVIEIVGRGELYYRLIDEVEPGNANKEVDLRVVIDNEKFKEKRRSFKPTHSSAKQHMTFNSSMFYYDEPLPYLCENLFIKNACCTLYVNDSLATNTMTRLRKLLSTSVNMRPEISYELFWYIIQVRLLHYECSFIHASIFNNHNAEALAFIGTGGSGKTSTMLKYFSKGRGSYMSEDFGIVCRDGNTLLSSKSLTIYQSDISSNIPMKKSFYKSLSVLSRLKWEWIRIFRGGNPKIRVPINEYFDRQMMGKKERINRAYYIIRSSTKNPSVEAVNVSEFTERVLSVTLREMKKLSELLNLISANKPVDYNYPSVYNISESIKSVYLQAFSDCETCIIEVPFSFTSNEMVEFLETQKIV